MRPQRPGRDVASFPRHDWINPAKDDPQPIAWVKCRNCLAHVAFWDDPKYVGELVRKRRWFFADGYSETDEPDAMEPPCIRYEAEPTTDRKENNR